MKKIILTVLLVINVITTQAQDVNWVSFEKALELNATNPKPILIAIYTDWCGWCKKMDKTTYKNEVITKSINENFYAVKMNGEGKEDITFKGHTFKFKAQGKKGFHELPATLMNGKLSYPSTIFLNKDKQLLQNVPGYLSKERMEQILAFFTNDTYKTANWKKFQKDFKSAL